MNLAMTSPEFAMPKVFLLIGLLFLAGMVVLFFLARSPGKRWLAALGGAGLIVVFLFLGVFLVRVGSMEQHRTATVQNFPPTNDYLTRQRDEAVGLRPVEPPWPNAPRQPPPVLRAPEGAAKPAPADPSKEWVRNAGGSRRLVETIGPVTIEVELPGASGELVGYSGLEPTEDEALKSARLRLMEKVKALVMLELAKKMEGRFDPELWKSADALATQFIHYLDQPGAEADHFQEPIQLPQSGNIVHRAAVMTRPGERVPQIASQLIQSTQEYRAEVKKARQTWAWTVASALVLGLFIYIIYSFLNAGTKGHLAWPLRLVSITAFLILAAVLLVVRGHLS